jgi:Acetyltransferase (GNAT) domain
MSLPFPSGASSRQPDFIEIRDHRSISQLALGILTHAALNQESGVDRSVYQMNPLEDSRWESFIESRPDASVFHSAGWLEALRKTYGYEPVVYTTAPPGNELSNGIVLCRVKSWLTGFRMVSVPFSDHCQPLVDSPRSLDDLITSLEISQQRERWKYFELRPRPEQDSQDNAYKNLSKSESYFLHSLDMRPDLSKIFLGFHKSCVQRKIHRAEREGLTTEEGRSQELLDKFYRLLILTRRRHGLPPQPLQWFQNLIESLGDKVVIRVASKDGHPTASILTIHNKTSLVYKYGCSDPKFHNLGGVLLLHWIAIQEGKRMGVLEYDLGRSERQNQGLITFKDNWGAKSVPLEYHRFPAAQSNYSSSGWRVHLLQHAFSRIPDRLLAATGRLLYRHIG